MEVYKNEKFCGNTSRHACTELKNFAKVLTVCLVLLLFSDMNENCILVRVNSSHIGFIFKAEKMHQSKFDVDFDGKKMSLFYRVQRYYLTQVD